MDMIGTLKAVENTLNQIEVKGRENMDRLLGCIIAVQKLQEKLKESGQDAGE